MGESEDVFNDNHNFFESIFSTRKRTSNKGRAFAIFSTIIFALANIFVKMTSRIVDPTQIIVVSGSFMVIASSCMVTTVGGTLATLNKRDVTFLFATGFLLMTILNLENKALSMSNAGDIIAVQYGAELLTSASITCIFSQRKQLTIIHCILPFTSALGILFIFRQDRLLTYQDIATGKRTTGFFISAGSGAGYSLLYTVLKFMIDRGISLPLIILVQSLSLLFGTLCITFICSQEWVAPDSFSDWTIYIICGGLEAFGTMASLTAIATDPLLSVSVILTFEVALTYFLELLVFYTVPALLSVTGSIIITLSCIGVLILDDDKLERTTKDGYIWIPPLPFSCTFTLEHINDKDVNLSFKSSSYSATK